MASKLTLPPAGRSAFRRFAPGACVLALLVVAIVCSGGAIVACLTDPPPDLIIPSQPPTIDHSGLVPPEGLITELPASLQFEVPIFIPELSAPCSYRVYLDGVLNEQENCDVSGLDAGIALNSFLLPETLDPLICHKIAFLLGADSATWTYVPQTCVTYDAGALQDGAFPEASLDALALAPESGINP